MNRFTAAIEDEMIEGKEYEEFDLAKDRRRRHLSKAEVFEHHARHMEKAKKTLDAESARQTQFAKVQKTIAELLKSKVAVFMDQLGAKAIIQIENASANLTTIEWLASTLAPKLKAKNIHLSSTNLREHIKTWVDHTPKIEKLPSSFSLDPNEISFNHILHHPNAGDCPTWDEFINKCGPNGEALKAFIWGLFEKDNRSQQYIFMKGIGRDGKGSLIRWLDKIFNSQLVGLDANDKHWPAACVGKRIGAFNDINATSLVMSAMFKQITGGDKVSIQQKYEKSFSTSIDTKFILSTNMPISISGSDADRRRAILIKMSPTKTHVPGFEDKLFADTSAFLFKCKLAYSNLFDVERQTIRCDYSFFDAESENFEEKHEVLFAQGFILDERSTISAVDFRIQLKSLQADDQQVGHFKEWLERTHSIKKTKLTTGTRSSVYIGLKAKPLRK